MVVLISYSLMLGGWLGMTCPHGICYGLKWLLRHEGPRDHVDMIMNLASVPNVVVVDMANMAVAHARSRGYNVFQPFDGRVAECNSENIEKASNFANEKMNKRITISHRKQVRTLFLQSMYCIKYITGILGIP